MALDCDCAESQLMNCFKVEIILKRNDDDSVLLWRWKDENKWELPWFLLRETESFQQEIERWCSNQLVSNVCGFTLAIVLYVETILNPTFVLYKFLYTVVRMDPLDCYLFRLPMKLVNMVKKVNVWE